MNKIFLFFLINTILSIIHLYAQNYTINYQRIPDESHKFEDHRKITITGNLQMKKICIIANLVDGDKKQEIKNDQPFIFESFSDTIFAYVGIQTKSGTPHPQTEIYLQINQQVQLNSFQIPEAQTYILMETYMKEQTIENNRIPIISFTTGAEGFRKIDGIEYPAIDFCAVRDLHIHPSGWTEKFNLPTYIYYEMHIMD